MKTKILVSACLLGHPVRYNGSAKSHDAELLAHWQAEGRVVVFCPELAAGLATPRPPAEIQSGDGEAVIAGRAQVRDREGRDMTQPWLLGAWLTLRSADIHQCRIAFLTEGSPSCGSQTIYDGTFSGRLRTGSGVVTALLRRHGIEVYSQHQTLLVQSRLHEMDKET
ncbi:DUF523 domain-containing protein [Entomohabitans teleogrylli]|uniref:DUF523 domain-containing protein n=1 Tax=Entomohabitans teleogrylli TaxID=1384589 RepID=UPI00073D97F9|nr:DUF523 domain-containing protein [Entomohabitans teleogrylli]